MENISQQIAQLFIVGIKGTKLSKEEKDFLINFQPGGIIFFEPNIRDKEQVKNLISEINNCFKVKPFISVDQEGGSVERLRKVTTSIPSLWGLNKISEEDLLTAQKIISDELIYLGFNMNFSPVLDINSNPENPVIGIRSLSNDPETVSDKGVKIGKLFLKNNLIPVVKHFPGHGDLNIDSHFKMPVLDKTKSELLKFELIPFIKAIKNNLPVVMVSHIQVPKIEKDKNKPASISRNVIKGLLINEMGFNGIVITDDLTMKGISLNYKYNEACREAILAYADLLILAGLDAVQKKDYLKSVVKVINKIVNETSENKILELRVKESYKKILGLKGKFLENGNNHTKINFDRNQQIANDISNRVTHWIKKELLYKPLSKSEPVDLIYPITPKLRKEDLEKALKELGIKKANLINYPINPNLKTIDELIRTTIKYDRQILITYDIAIRKRQNLLAKKLLRISPNLTVISTGLDNDVEFIPFINNIIAAYSPNYTSLLASFKKLLR